MRKIIIILVCLLLLASGAPLFAHGHRGHHGHHGHHGNNGHHGLANANRWHGSDVHPSFHGWRGWGKRPGHTPDVPPVEDPTKPPGDIQTDPGDKSGDELDDETGELILGGMILNLANGSFSG
jgi:hypothetical protein